MNNSLSTIRINDNHQIDHEMVNLYFDGLFRLNKSLASGLVMRGSCGNPLLATAKNIDKSDFHYKKNFIFSFLFITKK